MTNSAQGVDTAVANETAGFLDAVTPSLYCMIHHGSRGTDAAARGVVVLVPPFAEEKKAATRALVEAARLFAASGFDVLRFDFRGTGDSGGDFGDYDITKWREDLRAVLNHARAVAGDNPLHLVGLRFGAMLAWLGAQEEHRIDSLVLWEPITSGSTYMRQNRQRSNIRREITGDAPSASTDSQSTSSEAFDFDGFLISADMNQQMQEIDLQTAPLPAVDRLFLLQISGSERIRKPLTDLEARALQAGIETSVENIAVEAFWSAIGLVDTAPVRERTLHWLKQSAGQGTQSVSDGPGAILQQRTQSVCNAQVPVIADPLSFMSGDQRIHGVLYRPDAAVERVVLLLHGWSGYRIGPGHLLTEAARALAAAGCAAYSFDFRSRGESEWEVGEASLNSMIRDACRAVPIVLEKTGASKVTLLGLCSGAEVALGAGLSDPRIDSLALWSAPVFSGAFTTVRQLRRGRAAAKKYWQKLFYRETWAKLFSGGVNFKMVLRALSGGRSAEDAGVSDKAPDTAGQMKEFEAFSGRLLFIYGRNDPETAPSLEFYREFVERTGMPHQFHEVPGANHNYYGMAWKDEVNTTTLKWLDADTSTPAS